MPKPIIIVAGVAVVAIVGASAAFVMLQQNKSSAPSQADTSQSTSNDSAALDDPEGTYKYVSDPSVTKFPEKNAKFGNGQTFTFEYDGSKTNNDEYATLSYQLYYIQDDGKVQPMSGGNLDGKGKATFSTSDSVYTSNAKNHKGFFELIGTYDTSASDSGRITGKNVTLGMYPVVFDIAD